MSKITICSICARGGSKGVPGKNIKPIAGIPLLAHSISQAKESGLFKAIFVSSDSVEILNIAKDYGADYLIERPVQLSSDTSGKLDAIKHCFIEAEKILDLEVDEVVDLDCTSPLRHVEDIKNVVNLLREDGAMNVITGTPSHRSPYFNMVEVVEGQISLVKPTNVVRRQDTPKTYDMNASIYAWKRDVLLNEKSLFLSGTKLHIMPQDRSYDIDSNLDFFIVEQILNKQAEMKL